MQKFHRRIAAGFLTFPCMICGLTASGKDSAPPKDLIIDLGGGIRMEFVLIPAGSFIMGDEKGADRERPVHKVTISKPYYLARHEVTRAQYGVVMQSEPAKVAQPDYPVDFARWDTCQEFLARLNKLKPGMRFRLPTEAEWEYAARAGSQSRYFFGDDSRLLPEYAWFQELAGGGAHPVGQKKPNPWGLFDIYGNVWEWCQDYYGPYDAKDQTDPSGPVAGKRRVFRGGAWNGPSDRCRSAARDSFPAAAFVLGFRVVVPVPTR